MPKKKLTSKQEVFVAEYLKDLNATQAAIRAGYSKKTAESIGAENLRKPQIQSKIQEAMAKRSERTQVDQDNVIKELAKVAFSNMCDVADWGPEIGIRLHESDSISDTARGAVQKIKRRLSKDNDGNYSVDSLEIQLHDKLKALEMLGRHLGMFDGSGSSTGNSESQTPRILDAIKRLRGVSTA
jgi:phage terminase small subunit